MTKNQFKSHNWKQPLKYHSKLKIKKLFPMLLLPLTHKLKTNFYPWMITKLWLHLSIQKSKTVNQKIARKPKKCLWILCKTCLLLNHSNSPSNMSEVDSELHLLKNFNYYQTLTKLDPPTELNLFFNTAKHPPSQAWSYFHLTR